MKGEERVSKRSGMSEGGGGRRERERGRRERERERELADVFSSDVRIG